LRGVFYATDSTNGTPGTYIRSAWTLQKQNHIRPQDHIRPVGLNCILI
jgi:hypothetical protein